MPNPCPVCAAPLAVTRLDCPSCETRIEGRFSPGPFAGLSPEQVDFVLLFVRLEGKLRSMEAELGLSYPTIRARLHDIIRALGHQPGEREPTPSLSADERRDVLADLEAGLINATEALERLQP
jgi:hypothetical protein